MFVFIFILNFLSFRNVLFYFNFIDVFGVRITLRFLFDFFSLFFFLIVCLIVGVVIGYSLFYIGILNSRRFVYIVFLFSISIIILIFRGDFFIMILG